jgi:hypothetical protein
MTISAVTGDKVDEVLFELMDIIHADKEDEKAEQQAAERLEAGEEEEKWQP